MNTTYHQGRKYNIVGRCYGKPFVDLHLYGTPLHMMEYRLYDVPVSELYDNPVHLTPRDAIG